MRMKKAELLVMCLLLTNATLVMNGFFAPKDITYAITHRSLLCVVGLYGSLLFIAARKNKYVCSLVEKPIWDSRCFWLSIFQTSEK